MRIAWVIYGDIGQTTGGYIYDRLVVEGLRRAGDAVHVVSLTPRGVRGVLRGPGLARAVARLACDVVVGDELCFPELSGAFPRLATRLPRVLMVHHLSSWEGARSVRNDTVQRLERVTLRASDTVIATSQTTASRLAQEHAAHAVVAEPGADRLAHNPNAHRARAESDAIHLLFVGTLTPRKGVVTLLEALDLAAAQLPSNARLQLTLAGDDTRDVAYAAAVRARIAASPWLATHVAVAGLQTDTQLATLYARSDALVLPSRFEGYGMVLTEALAQGLPIMATTAGAIPSVVRHGAEARLVKADDAPALAEQIVRFACDASLRTSMRAAAEARRASLPTWAATTRVVRDALDAAVARAGRSAARRR